SKLVIVDDGVELEPVPGCRRAQRDAGEAIARDEGVRDDVDATVIERHRARPTLTSGLVAGDHAAVHRDIALRRFDSLPAVVDELAAGHRDRADVAGDAAA